MTASQFKMRLDSGQSGTHLLAGDSLTGEDTWKWPRKLAQAYAARYPSATVRIQLRSFLPGQPLPPDTTIQSGGSQIIRVLMDGRPGHRTIDCINRMQELYADTPIHLTSFFFGVNDFKLLYPIFDTVQNLVYLSNYTSQVYGSEIAIMTPAWAEDTLSPAMGGYADAARMAAHRTGAILVDLRKEWTLNYMPGNGYFGQRTRFNDASDNTHFNSIGHQAVVDTHMAALGY